MEVEAKFAVPNRRMYRRLAHLREVASYALVSAGSAQVDDDYFDTSDRRLLAADYTCRLRREGDAFLATLKGLGGADGAVHRRAEHEVRLATWTSDVRAWPESPARSLALELTRGAPLERLFGLTQTRSRADLRDGERRVAQLSLDVVQVTIGQRPASYYELEVELMADGTESDLAAVAAELATVWGLSAEPHSKFERGLALLDAHRGVRRISLSPEERSRLEAYAAGADAHLACRAKVFLARADGLPTREIVARCGLSAGRARFWLRAFRARRMGVFPAATSQQSGKAAKQQSNTQTPIPPYAHTALPTIVEFCRHHGVDLAHARHVEKQALALFAALKPVHRLPRKRRKLLRQASLLCTIGASIDPEHPHTAGRDLILAQPLRNVSTADRLALACVVAFQRDKVKPERELTLTALEEKQQGQVLAVSALLHLAEALDFSRSRTTQVKAVEGVDSKQCEVMVTGPQAGVDALQATARAGLWYQLFTQELVFVAPELEPAGPSPYDMLTVDRNPSPAKRNQPASREPRHRPSRPRLRPRFRTSRPSRPRMP